MNSKQRILTALSNKQPDKVPIFGIIDEPIIIAIAKILGFDTQEGKDLAAWDRYCLFVKELGLDATIGGASQGMERIGADLTRNRHGMVFRLSEHGEPVIVEGPIKEPSDVKVYELVKPSPNDFAQVQYVMEKVGQDTAHFMTLGDPFKTSWLLLGGMEKLLLNYSPSENDFDTCQSEQF